MKLLKFNSLVKKIVTGITSSIESLGHGDSFEVKSFIVSMSERGE
jgi:hypothetical protein